MDRLMISAGKQFVHCHFGSVRLQRDGGGGGTQGGPGGGASASLLRMPLIKTPGYGTFFGSRTPSNLDPKRI